MDFNLNYITNVYEDARRIVASCCENFTDPKIIFEISKARSFWAYVEKRQYSNYYRIKVSDVFAELTDNGTRYEKLLETLIHELVHTIPNCMNHKTYWKANCNKIKAKYPNFDLNRTASMEEFGIKEKVRETKYIITCEHCGQIWEYKRKPKWIDRCENVGCPYCNNRGMKVEKV